EAIKSSFPNIDGIGNFVSVEREFRFQTKCVACSQAARYDVELTPSLKHFVPHPGAGFFVARDVNFKPIFTGVSGPSYQRVGEPTNGAPSHPIEFHGCEFGISKLLEQVDRLGTLNRNLRVIV